MVTRFRYLATSLLTASLLNSPITMAAMTKWQIIPEKSTLTFTATQNGAPISGEFRQFDADIEVDPDNYQASKIHITVDMQSVHASYAELVKTLLSPPWFDATQFPRAEFTAKTFRQIDKQTYEADGTLTLRNLTQPVTLKFTAVQTGPETGHVEGSTTLLRNRFGVGQGEWASTDEVADAVTVHFTLEAHTAKTATAPVR